MSKGLSIRYSIMTVLLVSRIFVSNVIRKDIQLVENLMKQNSDQILCRLRSIGVVEEVVDDVELRGLQQSIENHRTESSENCHAHGIKHEMCFASVD